MADRKLRTDAKWLVDRTHVSTPYEVVAADIARRAEGWPQRDRAKAITDALIRHRQNKIDYSWVMGPH